MSLLIAVFAVIPCAESAPRIDGNLTARKLAVEASGVVPYMRFSSSGDAVFILNNRGVLRRVSVPDFKVTASVNLQGVGGWLSQSKAGLVALLYSTQEICVVEEATLKVLRRFKQPGARSIASSTASTRGYVTIHREMPKYIDFATGKTLYTINAASARKFASRVPRPRGELLGRFGVGLPKMTSDGKYLMAQAHGRLNTFRIEPNGMRWLQSGYHIADYPKMVAVSGDSKLVVLTAGSSNRDVPGHPKLNGGLYIYDVTNLLSPRHWIESGGGATLLAFDSAGRKVYCNNNGTHLVAFSLEPDKRAGRKIGECRLTKKVALAGTTQIVAHPAGNKLLLTQGTSLWWIEIKQD